MILLVMEIINACTQLNEWKKCDEEQIETSEAI